jgi:hypothetical protein
LKYLAVYDVLIIINPPTSKYNWRNGCRGCVSAHHKIPNE